MYSLLRLLYILYCLLQDALRDLLLFLNFLLFKLKEVRSLRWGRGGSPLLLLVGFSNFFDLRDIFRLFLLGTTRLDGILRMTHLSWKRVNDTQPRKEGHKTHSPAKKGTLHAVPRRHSSNNGTQLRDNKKPMTFVSLKTWAHGTLFRYSIPQILTRISVAQEGQRHAFCETPEHMTRIARSNKRHWHAVLYLHSSTYTMFDYVYFVQYWSLSGSRVGPV